MTQSKLRFKREDGTEFPEWVMKQFSDISVPFKKRNKACLNLEIYSINNQVGFIPQEEQFEDAGYLNDTDTSIYMIVPPNHFAYNPARINVGSIGYQNVGHDVQVSSLYEVFATTGECDDSFIWHWFHTPLFNKMVMKYGEGGVRVYYYYDKLCETPIVLPCLEEQQKIANFLSTVDEVITQSEAEVQNLKQQKKAAMQKIFSQEVRFKRDDGTEFPEWEEKSLKDCTNFIKDGTHGTHKDVEQGYYLLSAKDVFNGDIHIGEDSRIISQDDFNSIYKQYSLAVGDVILTIVGTLGRTAVISEKYVKVVFQRSVAILRPNSLTDSYYLRYTMENNSFQNELEIRKSKGAQAGVYLGTLAEIEIPFPCLEEQQKIADFLSAYDDAISYAKQELDKWKELKKGLLQQMFV